MIQPNIDDKLADKLFPNGIERVELPSGKNYMRMISDY